MFTADYGRREPGPAPRTSEVIIGELHELLRTAAVPGPYLLVGHSFGGLNMQFFASRFPAETAGLVLVDGTHPAFADRLPEALRSKVLPSPTLPLVGKLLSPLGIPRLTGTPVIPDLRKLPPAALAQANALGWRYQTYATFADELKHVHESEAQVRAAAPLRADLPLTVITAPMKSKEAEAIKQTLHAELADQSTNGRLVRAEATGHFVHIDQPQLVIDAILLRLP